MTGSVEAVPPRSAVRLSAAKRFPERPGQPSRAEPLSGSWSEKSLCVAFPRTFEKWRPDRKM